MTKKQQQRLPCMFCGSNEPLTREHVFRSTWKKTLEVNQDLVQIPGVERKFRKYNPDDLSMTRDKNEDLFSVIVKRVCDTCNNEWMNDLDSAVEPWVFNPDDDENRCDPRIFRRWAIKIALLRESYDNLFLVDSTDPPRVYGDEDIAEWHVFIGHTEEPEHRHSQCGIGPVLLGPMGGRAFGITQVSWTLGRSLVTALRVHGTDDISINCFLNFRQYNGIRRGVVREVKPNATEMPTVRLLPALPEPAIQELVWLYTPHPVSPIADAVREANEYARELAKKIGIEWNDPT
jgi:hypothetical protein